MGSRFDAPINAISHRGIVRRDFATVKWLGRSPPEMPWPVRRQEPQSRPSSLRRLGEYNCPDRKRHRAFRCPSSWLTCAQTARENSPVVFSRVGTAYLVPGERPAGKWIFTPLLKAVQARSRRSPDGNHASKLNHAQHSQPYKEKWQKRRRFKAQNDRLKSARNQSRSNQAGGHSDHCQPCVLPNEKADDVGTRCSQCRSICIVGHSLEGAALCFLKAGHYREKHLEPHIHPEFIMSALHWVLACSDRRRADCLRQPRLFAAG
jgi:hypothetical protein